MIPAPVGAGRGPALARRLALAALLSVIVLSTGCVASGTAISTPFATTPPVLEHGPQYEVKVASVGGLGPVLVDGQGITLYMYATDHQGTPSRCYSICAVQWPPLILPTGVAAPVAGPGIEPGLLGTAPRTDGTTQITYNGWPLYLWPPGPERRARPPGRVSPMPVAAGTWSIRPATRSTTP